jgi:hypothetical protein
MIPPDAHAGDAPRRWRQSSRSRSPTPWRRFSVACTALRPSGAIVCLASAQAGDAGEPDARRSHPRASSTHPPPLTCTDSKRIWPEHSHRPLYGSRHGRGASARPCFLSRRLHHQSVGVLASRAAFPRPALAFAIPGERHCRFCLIATVDARVRRSIVVLSRFVHCDSGRGQDSSIHAEATAIASATGGLFARAQHAHGSRTMALPLPLIACASASAALVSG